MAYNLNEIKKNFPELKDFEFIARSAAAAADKFGTVGLTEEDFSQPGLYSVVIGSRGMLEDVNLVESFEIPTIEEIADGDEEYVEMIEEFYDIEEDVEDSGVLIFGFNDEDYEVFILVDDQKTVD